MRSNKDISSLSYTNKDFNSIYTELLEYAKKLSYRWDPSASDESDPGVVLLKLAAIIGDKNNYNIDKNVLELMPNSVTQLSCARQLFEQCGYIMHHFQSAEGSVRVTLTGHPEEIPKEFENSSYLYTIPRFTMFSDLDNKFIYTSVKDVCLEYQTKGPNKISADIPVLEGTAVQYKINNDSLITTANLDNNNRLYFSNTDIAENGIFINNVNSSNVDNEWYRVDTLETEPKGSYCYKFGVSLDGSLCYIEFPDDADLLFGEGLNITYIRTKGLDGNIISSAIRQFYVDTSLKRSRIGDTDDVSYVTISAGSTENSVINIINDFPVVGGKNPETIDEAYSSYRRVKETFNTIVSSKDYTDYMITTKSASNGYVCDRKNDIQHSYKIKQSYGSGNVVKTIIEKSEVVAKDKNNNEYVLDVPSMEPFDLCVYALQYVATVDSDVSYAESFRLTEGRKYIELLNNSETVSEVSDLKSLQHDFIDFDTNKILMIKNKYPIKCTIIPRYELTPTEIFDITSKVELSLYRALNSKSVYFGTPITFDLLESTILNSDDRIKHVEGLTTPVYTTWAVYKNSNNLISEMRIDSDSFSGGYVLENITSSDKFNDYINSISLYYYNYIDNKMTLNTDSNFDKTKKYYSYDQGLHNLWVSFRADIYAKNILSGSTQLYDKQSNFVYSVNQQNTSLYQGIEYVDTNTNINFTSGNDSSWLSDELKENENILLTVPNYVEESNYSSYVKVIYSLNSNFSTNSTKKIDANSTYSLEGDDFIIFFWKKADSDDYYTYVKYDSSTSSPASAISSSQSLYREQRNFDNNSDSPWDPAIIKYFRNTCTSGKGTTLTHGEVEGDPKKRTMTDFVASLNSSAKHHVLTGTHVIKTLKMNKVFINNELDGTENIAWILNTITTVDGKPKYRLFDKTSTTYTLKAGEYFLYSNSSKTVLYIKGEGTVIERSSAWLKQDDAVWDIDKFNYIDILSEGITFLDPYWKKIKLSSTFTVTATEMKRQLIGPQNKVSLKVVDIEKVEESEDNIKKTEDKTTISSICVNNKPVSLRGFKLSYSDPSGNIINIDSVESSDVNWTIQSLLNINMSSSEPQMLLSNQSISFHMKMEKDITTISGSDDNPVYVLCDSSSTESSEISLNLVGGTHVDLSPLTDTKFDFLVFSSPTTSEEKKYSPNYDLQITGELDKNDVTIEFSENDCFRLIKGSYLLHVDPDTEITELNITCEDDGVSIESLLPSDKDLNTLYKIHVEKDSDIHLKIELTFNSKSVSLHFHPLFHYSNQSLSKIRTTPDHTVDVHTSFEESLLLRLSELDVSNVFDYTSIVKQGISDPLKSSSFFNKKHFYCPFTICEWKPEKSVIEDVVVSSGVR